jgi:hypothetical protein
MGITVAYHGLEEIKDFSVSVFVASNSNKSGSSNDKYTVTNPKM